jgi:pimeloyl-ACP methyl ester carboxylesterase
MTYSIARPPERPILEVRGLEFQLYRWSGDDPDPIVLVHGWGDTGETWQFVVDRLPPHRSVLAYDARGFGGTQWQRDGYWFPDYLADLEAIIDHVSPHAPVDLAGHSMGGNVAMLYAGVRPNRVRRLMNLEGFGMRRTQPDQAPARYREWLDEMKEGQEFATYDSFEHFASILARRNPRTPPDRLDFIARSWGRQRADGRIELRADPRHKHVNPVLYQREQALACWKEITAPTQLVIGSQSDFTKRMLDQMAEDRWEDLFDHTTVMIPDAGHMLHHEQPEAIAELIREWFVELRNTDSSPQEG